MSIEVQNCVCGSIATIASEGLGKLATYSVKCDHVAGCRLEKHGFAASSLPAVRTEWNTFIRKERKRQAWTSRLSKRK